ncbi:unnamed protein product, partial [Prorocentrum cordatum]
RQLVDSPDGSVVSRPSPSSSSRAPAGGGDGVVVFPEQLVTQKVGDLGEYAQFVCKICNLVVRSPLMLPCAHMFCSTCFNQWVQQKRPNVSCPTCEQAVRSQEVVRFEGTNGRGGALALLHRLYSGMKVKCAYNPELLESKPLTSEAARAKASGLRCDWRGAMHDYATHLKVCKVHAEVAAAAAAPAGASSSQDAAAPSPPQA